MCLGEYSSSIQSTIMNKSLCIHDANCNSFQKSRRLFEKIHMDKSPVVDFTFARQTQHKCFYELWQLDTKYWLSSTYGFRQEMLSTSESTNRYRWLSLRSEKVFRDPRTFYSSMESLVFSTFMCLVPVSHMFGSSCWFHLTSRHRFHWGDALNTEIFA